MMPLPTTVPVRCAVLPIEKEVPYEDGIMEARRNSSPTSTVTESPTRLKAAARDGHKSGQSTSAWSYVAAIVLAYVSYATYPTSLVMGPVREGGRRLFVRGVAWGLIGDSRPPPQVTTAQHVWYYGWITALSTGLGTLPFLIVSEMNQWWLGISNGEAHHTRGEIPSHLACGGCLT
jgi:hypothetical protein